MALTLAAKAALTAASKSKTTRNIIIFLVSMILGTSILCALQVANYGAVFWQDDIADGDVKKSEAYRSVRQFYIEYGEDKNEEIRKKADQIQDDNMDERTVWVYNPSSHKMEEVMEPYCKVDVRTKDYQYLPTAYILAYLNCKNKRDYLQNNVSIQKEEVFGFLEKVDLGVQADHVNTEGRPRYDVYSKSMAFDDIVETLFGSESEREEYKQCVYFISQLIGDEEFAIQSNVTVSRVRRMEIPLYYQYSQPWGSMRYGNGNIARSGCAPTCIAMIVSYFEGKNVYPDEIVAFTGNRYYVSGAGSSWSIFPACADNWNINCVQLPLHQQTIADKLSEGKPVILSMGAGTFTSAGHFIVLTGINEYGYVSVNDPNDNNNKNFRNREFNIDQLVREAKGGWYFDR